MGLIAVRLVEERKAALPSFSLLDRTKFGLSRCSLSQGIARGASPPWKVLPRCIPTSWISDGPADKGPAPSRDTRRLNH